MSASPVPRTDPVGPTPPMPNGGSHRWIPVIYAVMGSAWILASDLLISTLLPTIETFATASLTKGLFYVLVTALLLAVILEIAGAKRRHAEAGWREMMNRYWTLLDGHSIPHLLLDPADGGIVGANAAATRFYGIGRGRLLEHRLDEISETAQSDLADALQENTGAGPSHRTRHKRADGSWIPVELHAHPVRINDRLYVYMAVIDITARVAAEAAAEAHARELEHANADLSRFTLLASHDLKAPLVNLNGFAQELRRAVDRLDQLLDADDTVEEGARRQEARSLIEEDIRPSLRYIEASGEKMGRLIEGVVALSREGRLDIRYEEVDLEALVARIRASLEYRARQRSAEIVVAPLPRIETIAFAIEHILANLLDNAVKFLPTDRAGRIDIAGAVNDDQVVLTIADNGPGLAAGGAEGSHARHDQDRGHGLGLGFARALVERLGGRLEEHSETGKGTTFTLVLPRRPASPEAASRARTGTAANAIRSKELAS